MTKISHVRHLAKAISWRVLASTETFILGWLITGSPTVGASISLIELFSKTLLYYLHERAWYHFSDLGVTHLDGGGTGVGAAAGAAPPPLAPPGPPATPDTVTLDGPRT